MSSSFRKTVEKLAEQAGEGDRRPCLRCDTPTAITTLGQYGARCFRCFEDYCAAAFAPTPPTYDTVQQAEMRTRLKGHRQANVLSRTAELDEVARNAAKAEANRRVAEYARKHGLELEQERRA